MSSHQMTEETLPAYIDRIRKFRPRFIHAYPSTAVILARYMREHRIEPFPTVRAILCGSENLYPWQRGLLEEAFGCRVFSWYGNSEQTVPPASAREHLLHIFPSKIVELMEETAARRGTGRNGGGGRDQPHDLRLPPLATGT
jgi:phenylacetate-CoA ligase